MTRPSWRSPREVKDHGNLRTCLPYRFQPMSDFDSYLLTEEDFIQPGSLFSESEPGVSKDWRRRTTQTIGPHLDLAPQVNRLNHVGVSRSPVTSQTGLVRAPSGRSSHRTYLPDRRSIMQSRFLLRLFLLFATEQRTRFYRKARRFVGPRFASFTRKNPETFSRFRNHWFWSGFSPVCAI